MQIKFARSGGLAGMPGLNVEGTVDLGDQAASVTSESSKYRRALAPPEVEQLRSAADPEGMSRARTALASHPPKVRDGFQYDITVATKDGKSHKLTFNAAGGEELNRVAPAWAIWCSGSTPRLRESRNTG